MRSIFTISLSLLISFQSFYNLGVLAYWLANQPRIAATLCENRDRPETNCEGKCFLKKKIADAPDAPASPTKSLPTLKKGIEVAEIPPSANVPNLPIAAVVRSILLAVEPCFAVDGMAKLVFRPPAQHRLAA